MKHRVVFAATYTLYNKDFVILTCAVFTGLPGVTNRQTD